MNIIKFKTSGMHCPSCSMLIQLNVSDLAGVESVSASHADGLTTVTFDATVVTVDQIADEIRAAGYEVEVLA